MQYRETIIGRHREQEILQACCDSHRAEFVAVYGRRRIGKTYLVKQFFADCFDFYATGIYQVSRSLQLRHWQEQLQHYSGVKRPRPKDWFEAFGQLREHLATLSHQPRIVIFIDELPWFDTPKSGFIRALDLFWNSWAADQANLKLITCGSATTWMTNKLLGDKGGLHNRVTRPLRLAPFTLAETEAYLQSLSIEWERPTILDAYMVMGGIPFYLSMLQPSMSLEQNINTLFFGEDATLATEYDFLFRSLFNEAALYRRVVEVIVSKVKGLTRSEIVAAVKATDSGYLSEVLDNLIKCSFVRRYQSFGKRDRDAVYQVTDMYTLFYLRFVKGYAGMDTHAWSNVKEGVRNAWAGYAFEQVCMLHADQIKRTLGIAGIATSICSWRCQMPEGGGQIDMVIDRADRCVDLCEIKYSIGQYELTKDYVDTLRQRRELFRSVTGTSKSLRLTFITTAGLKPNKYTSAVQSSITLDNLFNQ